MLLSHNVLIELPLDDMRRRDGFHLKFRQGLFLFLLLRAGLRVHQIAQVQKLHALRSIQQRIDVKMLPHVTQTFFHAVRTDMHAVRHGNESPGL